MKCVPASRASVRQEEGPLSAPEGGVPVAAVVDETGRAAILEAFKGDGCALHVDEDLLEAGAVLGVEPSGGVGVEATVPPALEHADALLAEDLALEHELERAVAEELLEGREVEILGDGVEAPAGVEDPQARERVEVGVGIEEAPVALGGDDHGGDGAPEPGEMLPEELARRGVGGAGDLAVERSIEEERFSEDLRDREDELDVGDVGEDLAHHALGPEESALLGARRAETPCLTGEFVVMARWMGPRIVQWLEVKLEGELGLTVNRDKTHTVRMHVKGESLNFLGYTFRFDRDLRGRDRRYLNIFPSEKAEKRLREKIKAATRHTGRPIWEAIDEVSDLLRSWSQYFGYGYPRKVYRAVNHYVLECFRSFLRRQSHRRSKPFRKGASLYAGIRRLGFVPL
jgi:hypothetical protein